MMNQNGMVIISKRILFSLVVMESMCVILIYICTYRYKYLKHYAHICSCHIYTYIYSNKTFCLQSNDRISKFILSEILKHWIQKHWKHSWLSKNVKMPSENVTIYWISLLYCFSDYILTRWCNLMISTWKYIVFNFNVKKVSTSET